MWFQGLRCLGNPIGTSPTLTPDDQPSSCISFKPEVPTDPKDPSNPYRKQGAYSAVLTYDTIPEGIQGNEDEILLGRLEMS